jgi:hypothetical protein
MTTMNTETQNLMLKARKLATSSFAVKHWTLVLQALGFKVEVTEKDGRKVVGMRITSPSGLTLDMKKPANYRAMAFYDLIPWMKKNGMDLVALASAALGLDTPDEEKRLRDLYIRDLTNTGTCGVCGGNFKRDSGGGLVNHGFQRPGDGMIHGNCFGVGYQPWEISSQGASEYVAQVLRPSLANTKKHLAALERGDVKSFTVEERPRGAAWNAPKVRVTVTAETDAYRFNQMVGDAKRRAEYTIDCLETDIERFEAKIGTWKVGILPEILHAGKFLRDSSKNCEKCGGYGYVKTVAERTVTSEGVTTGGPMVVRARCTCNNDGPAILVPGW